MAPPDGSSDAAEIVGSIGELAPVVGHVLGTLARIALSQDEHAALHECLENALRTDVDRRRHSKLRVVKNLREQRAWRAARRLAAEDLLTFTDLLESQELPEHLDVKPTTVDIGELPGSQAAILLGLREVAWTELANALAPGEHTPWTARVSAALTLAVEGRVAQIRAATVANVDEADLELHRRVVQVIAGKEDARLEDLGDDEFENFGRRVGRRFEANMASHPKLRSLVDRLDQFDRQQNQAALITAAQGIRVALLTLALAALVGAAVAVERLAETLV
jgi:hypothetical protein